MVKNITVLILISVALCGCQQVPQPKITIEEVIGMDKDELGSLPAECAVDIVYDLCQEVKRLRRTK